jgi:diketogulonate reductase-like aldo/keto reductase
LAEISARTGHSWAQLVIAWAIRRGTSLVPKSTTPARIEENFTAVELSDEDFEAIDTITEKRPELETNYTDFFDISWDVAKQLGAGMWEY